MMAVLFLIFLIILGLIHLGLHKTALVLTLINLLLCLLMFWHHITEKVNIML